MGLIISCLIFILCYILIISEKINRALVACSGGVLMVLLGIVNPDQIFSRYIDWHTIALLFSMMILVSITSQNGVFEYLAIRLAQRVKGRPIALLTVVSVLTALGSAFLDNVTTVLLFVPIILKLTEILRLQTTPFLISAILFSNIGGTATLIGDPPNIMIGQANKQLGFNDFIIHLGPVIFIIFLTTLAGLVLFYKSKLTLSHVAQERLMKIKAGHYLKKGPVLMKSLSVLFVTIAGFILHPFIHTDITTISMAGALLLLLLTYKELSFERIIQGVDWITLFFFVGLFMLVGGLTETGLIDKIAKGMMTYTNGNIPLTALLILWGSGILSGFVDNIPFVAAMIPVIQEFEQYGVVNSDPLWWALALGSCLGGNMTLIGASANVIVAGLAHSHHTPLTFLRFMKFGVPVVLLSLIISTIYLFLRYFITF